MTKTKTGNERKGAALMIAVITALMVMLAATLLLNLTERMVESHAGRLYDAQIALSEASAADGLASLIEREGTDGFSAGTVFELAGVETVFTLMETGTAGIRTGFYQLEDVEGTIVIPGGDRMVTASSNGETVTVVFYSNATFNPTMEFTFETGMRPVAGTGITIQDETGAVVVLQGFGETTIIALTETGVAASSTTNSVSVSPGALISASCSPSGDPLVIVTGGSGSGALHNIATGETRLLASPPGTCPVFMPDGTVFGSFSHAASFSIARVKDVFPGDFNSDGFSDMAFATSFSLMVCSGANGELYRALPGGSLICWGQVHGRNGISGMWRLPSGEEAWLRLGYDGFVEFIPEAIYRMGWEGRYEGYGNTFSGIIQGSAVVASASGYLQELFSGGVFPGNADGGSLDFFVLRENGVEAFFNPVDGDGVRMVFQAENTLNRETRMGNTHVFSIFESGNRRRVFHSLQGERP